MAAAGEWPVGGDPTGCPVQRLGPDAGLAVDRHRPAYGLFSRGNNAPDLKLAKAAQCDCSTRSLTAYVREYRMGHVQRRDSGFDSNVAPPPRPRPTAGQLCGRIAFAVAVPAGLVAAVLVGTPALQTPAAGHAGTAHGTAGALP